MSAHSFVKRRQILLNLMVPLDKKKRLDLYLYALFLSLAVLLCIADRAPMHLDKKMNAQLLEQGYNDYYDGVFYGKLGGPYVYRILVPYTVRAVHNFVPGVKPMHIDLFFQFLFLFGCQLVMYHYLRLFVSRMMALGGVLLFVVLMGYMLGQMVGLTSIETSDTLNVLVLLLALYFLYKNKLLKLLIVLFIGMFNRETPMVLLPVLLYYEWTHGRPKINLLWITLVVFIPYVALRFWWDGNAVSFEGITSNIPFLDGAKTVDALKANVYVFVLLAPLLLIAAFRFRELPTLVRFAAALTIPFIVLHYIVGTVIEARLWMPLLVLLVPAVTCNLHWLFRNTDSK